MKLFRPTHLLGFQIVNQQILDQIRSLQESVYSKSFSDKNELQRATLDIYNIILNLGEVSIQSEEDYKTIIETIELGFRYWKSINGGQKVTLKYAGVGCALQSKLSLHPFNDEDLKRFQKLSGILRRDLKNAGIDLKVPADFLGQIIVMKLSEEQQKNGLKIEDSLWSDKMYEKFGRQVINEISLFNLSNKPRFSTYAKDWTLNF